MPGFVDSEDPNSDPHVSFCSRDSVTGLSPYSYPKIHTTLNICPAALNPENTTTCPRSLGYPWDRSLALSWTEQTRASLAGTVFVSEKQCALVGYMSVCLERDINRAASSPGGLWSRHTHAYMHIRACICAGLFHRAACVSRDVGQPSLPACARPGLHLPRSHAQLWLSLSTLPSCVPSTGHTSPHL